MIPGAVNALTGTILGYPFDTIKSKMQKNPIKYTSAYNCFLHTIKTRGIVGLYSGLPAPLTIMMIKRGFQYNLYEKFNKYNFNSYVTGGLSGAICSIVGCPMHYIKINMQIGNKFNKIANIKDYNTLDLVKYTFKTKGIKGFYHGIKIDCLKESSFSCLYLGTYGYLRKKTPQNSFYHFLSGGISSVITWTILFPIDSLRTYIMTNDTNNNNIIYNFKKLIEGQKITRLWKGLGPILLRIFPVSAISMTAYEYSRKLME